MPKEGYPLKKQLCIAWAIKTGLHVLDPTCRLKYLHVNECIKLCQHASSIYSYHAV